MLKGVWIQEGSLLGGHYTSRTSVWGLFDMLALVTGVQAPFFIAILSLVFNCFFSFKVFTVQAFTDEVLLVATMVAAFLIHLGIF